MRFTVRAGKDPVIRADGTILAAMGMPGGGIISIGKTHALVRAGDVPEPTALLLGPRMLDNAGLYLGQGIDAKRIILPTAALVVIEGAELPLDAKAMARALQGIPVSIGDVVGVDPAYADGAENHIEVRVIAVEPGQAVMVGANTRIVPEPEAARREESPEREVTDPELADVPRVPSTAEALLAGLTNELDVLTGWFSLLTGHRDLPAAWGLPEVAGVIVEGPTGCGKVELVHAAAEAVDAHVHEVNVDLVFKPQKLLDLLEKAVKTTPVPGVVMINRLEAVTGEEGLSAFKTQVGAILRWFLDAVSERRGLAAVLGVSSLRHLDDTITKSPLLPRTLSIPPPNLERRKALYEAALAKVPTADVDYAQLAARSAGFSGADILAAVVHASAMVARNAGDVTTELMTIAIEATTPSLGTVSMGEIPSYGFERVAGLEDVKQRLTEAVIWPMTQPERFASMGIDPPRGILLYGPPGTGKTFVIRALAHESGAAFFPIKGAELLDKFVGESERGVREVFSRARAVAPSILFFDEIDALAPVRGSSTTSVTDSVVAALLTEMDGIGERGDVVVIGATNRKDLVDPALLRSGRFETHIELGLPDVEGRRALIAITDVPFSPEVDLDELARKTEGLSFADLTGLFREAALMVLRKNKTELAVGWEELDAALLRFQQRQNS
ncbi:MAG: ATP-binding protein [Acidimicrobiia bacterium]|nr:ATP-binding protein [Acidimicrobiia bacterium]